MCADYECQTLWAKVYIFKNCTSLNAFAWYSSKIRVIFGIRVERRKVDKKANLHENGNMQTLLESFKHLHQISSKSIIVISSYAVSKLVRFLRHSVIALPFCHANLMASTALLCRTLSGRNCYLQPSGNSCPTTWLPVSLCLLFFTTSGFHMETNGWENVKK